MAKTLLPYLLVALVNLIACGMGDDTIRMITKPLLMPALAFFFIKSAPQTVLSRYVLAALAFSFLGDTLLMFTGSNSMFFTLGLAAFLLAHLVYIVINISAVSTPASGFKVQWQDLPFFLYGFVIFGFLKDDLGQMYFPALAYAVVICIMGLTARKRWKRTDNTSFWYVMSGALMFMLSDTLLAFNKFSSPIPQADLWIMSTYIIAQFLIIRGLIAFIQKIPHEAGS